MPKKKQVSVAPEPKEEPKLHVELVRGVEGPSLYINNYRVCGSKPWAGGTVAHSWHARKEDIERALKMPPPDSPAPKLVKDRSLYLRQGSMER